MAYAKPPEVGWTNSKDCEITKNVPTTVRCCWRERVPGQILGVTYCQTCTAVRTNPTVYDCTAKEKQAVTPPTTGENIVPGDTGVLEQPPTPPSFDSTAPLQGGVLEQQPQTPPPSAPGASPGILEQLEQGSSPELGFSERQQLPPADQGATELPPPATEQTQPATVEEEQSVPVCQEGLEFNEDLGFCVPTECPEGQELNEETGICVLEEQLAADEEPEEQQQTEGEQPSEESGSEEDNSNN